MKNKMILQEENNWDLYIRSFPEWMPEGVEYIRIHNVDDWQEINFRQVSINDISYVYDWNSQRECIDYCKWLIDWLCLDINEYI